MAGYNSMWEVCWVSRATGPDDNGQPAYTDPQPTRAWITRRTKLLRKEDGTDIASTAQVTLPPSVTAAVNDWIFLPETPHRAQVVQQTSLAKGPFGIKAHTVAFL